MTKATDSRSSKGRSVLRNSSWVIVIAVIAAGLSGACRRHETPPVSPDTNRPPVIARSPQSGQPPYEGLAEPRGAALDAQGRLWVADFGHSRVRIFAAGGGLLGTIGGIRGNGPYQLQEPGDTAIHGDDVYVADTWNGRVQHFTIDGKFRETTATGLYGPRGVAVAPDGAVWIADTGNNRIAVRRGTAALVFFGRPGRDPGHLFGPVGIAVGPSGNVYVADVGNHRLQVFNPRGEPVSSTPVAAWEGPAEPHLAADSKEHLYLTVPSGGEVRELDRTGKVVRRWNTDDKGNKFVRPTGLALDERGQTLTVIDSGNNGVVQLSLRDKRAS